MKSLTYPLVVTLLAAALPLASLKAEPNQSAPGGGPGNAPADGKRPDMAEKMKERQERMKQELGLSDDQSAKIAAIGKESFEAMKAIKDDTSLSEEARKAKMKELRKATDDKMNAVLTPEQQAKRETMKKEHKDKGPGQGQGQGSGPK